MSRLAPGLIVLDKGLNLQTPKITAPEGSVLDTLNYEQVDFQGQKRIEGYVRYDGSLGSYIDDYFSIGGEGFDAASVGQIVMDQDSNIIGIVVGEVGTTLSLAIIDYNRIPTDDQSLIIGNVPGYVVGAVDGWGSDIHTIDVHYANLLAYNQVLRDTVESLPGPVAALHWFNDRLYAVASVLTIYITTTSDLHPNDTITIGTDSAIVLKVEGSAVAIATVATTPWTTVGNTVERNSVEVGTTAGLAPSDIASFFESRTELQVFEEDGNLNDLGWKFNYTGWVVPFENGVSLYGSLPSLNQNIQGLGIQGPTTTSGNNGRPLLLTQGVTISGEKAQVSGWKSSQTPTSYALNPSDVWDDDTTNSYADAYISWDGTTGQVSAPGVTTAVLEQYPADNTVIVEGV